MYGQCMDFHHQNRNIMWTFINDPSTLHGLQLNYLYFHIDFNKTYSQQSCTRLQMQ
jgi:hypothetical protein